ncbi:uncharacterized protein LOC135206084 [Macrobrachium nipponense]|uniref:uncharacterized protein LOC135206084 n=1 Tax=Macrobrachium nipponense TaxID=159736 RepID=UPI0030C8D42A
MPQKFKFSLAQVYDVLKHVNSTDLSHLSEGEIPFGTLIYLILSIAVHGIIVPLFRIGAATFISAAFKVISILVFGPEEMDRMVGTEGYIYYGYIILKQFWEYGNRFRFHFDPMRVLRVLLVGSEPIDISED